MDLSLQVSSGSLSEEELHEITWQLAKTIDSETDITAKIPEHQPAPGAKGASSILGEIALMFVSSGAGEALIGVLKAYFDRPANFIITIKRPDGSEITISAQNMKPEQIEATAARVNDFFRN